MYAVIKIGRKVLISPAEVINNISADSSLSIDKVQHSIIIAEERFVRTFLGWDLYEQILAAKNQVVTDANKAALQAYVNAALNNSYELQNGDIVNASEFLPAHLLELWNNYLCKYVAEAVKYTSIPDMYADFNNSGIMKNNPAVPTLSDNQEQVAAIGLNEAKWLMDKAINDRLEPMKNAMHVYICRNVSLFPYYAQPCDCGDTKANGRPKTGYVDISIYRDEDEADCLDCYPGTLNNNPSPATTYNQFSEQWVTVPGQTQYPYPGQFNEHVILNRLKGATLLTMNQEGVTMYIGQGIGEVVGIDPVTGRITWNTPAPDQEIGLRMQAQLQR